MFETGTADEVIAWENGEFEGFLLAGEADKVFFHDVKTVKKNEGIIEVKFELRIEVF